jgi:CheY-like chemotaxis protein
MQDFKEVGMSKKLLLADDSITIQKVIQITFAHEDYELTITDNGDAALAKAQELHPDLVMADVYMPGKNGYELTTAIRQDPVLQNVPVLLLAGSFEPFDEDKARGCQANAWIEKPFESQSLIDKVAELLSAGPTPAEEPVAIAEPAPAAAAPVSVTEAPVEQPSIVSSDEPAAVEPELAAAASDDPFGDISFAEEAPATVAEAESVSATDDWSDVAAEQVVAAPVVEESPVAEETPVFEESTSPEEAPFAAVEPDAFAMDDDEIMSLDEDDILGAEDLEPIPPEQTLAAWSRDEAADDAFAESLSEEPLATDDVFAVEEPAAVADVPAAETGIAMTPAFDEPDAAESVAFAEPVAEPIPVEDSFEQPEEVPVAEEEPEPAATAATIADVEAKAAALGDAEIEQIIEKVVTKVVEKLAGSILERVAWEVVPDMAENLIREEIRKIKDAAA